MLTNRRIKNRAMSKWNCSANQGHLFGIIFLPVIRHSGGGEGTWGEAAILQSNLSFSTSLHVGA